MKPFLSVITINLNNAEGLRGTIESVLSQDGIEAGDLEYVIIDGSSTDGSADVIKEYDARGDFPHKIAYWMSEKDSGIYNAMNKGIRACHGKYVAILNSGDYYVKDALRGLKDEALKHEGAVLYGSVDCFDGGIYSWTSGRSINTIDNGMIPHEGCFVPRTIYDKYGLYDESFRILADWNFFSLLVQKHVPFCHISKTLLLYDLCGVSGTPSERYNQEFSKVQERYFGKRQRKRSKLNKFIDAITPPILLRLMKKCKRALKAKK